MIRWSPTVAASFIALAIATNAGAASALPSYINAAVNDASRPDADKARDADRKPGEMLAFSGLKPGANVADMIPGGGYFTRLFAKAAGPKGHVYAFVPDELLKKRATAADGMKALAADPGFSNVSVVGGAISAFSTPEPLDLAWTSQNYHDLHNWDSAEDLAAFNKAVFNALKPGGVYIVLDHAAAVGSPLDVTETLHRIDAAVVKREVVAAGFKFEGTSDFLKISSDDKSARVFEAGGRGKPDKFFQ